MLTLRPVLHILFALFLTVLIQLPPAAQAQTGPRYPFPHQTEYAPGSIKPNHRSQARLDDDVRAFYEHWKASYLVQEGTNSNGDPLYRVSFGSSNPGRTVSEGQGFGMIIVALMAGYDAEAQTIFDGLWEFSRRYPSNIDSRLMDWQWETNNTGPDASAFDGDADIAYGLLLAEAQWGDTGRFDYQAAAGQVIAGILESTIGPDSRLPMLGDWVQADGEPHNQYTPRSSDFMPSHFRAYGRATNDPVWEQVVANSQALIEAMQTNHSSATGLLPDFIVKADQVPEPAYTGFLEGEHDGHYYYNAGRDPWRIGMDALLNNDAASAAQAQKMSGWLERATGGDPANIKGGYRLDGTPIGNYFSTFFAAPFGVAAMTDASQQAWLNAIYEAVYQTHENYYEDSVTLLSLLVMTGNYWDPTTVDQIGNDKPLDERLFLPLIIKPAAGK